MRRLLQGGYEIVSHGDRATLIGPRRKVKIEVFDFTDSAVKGWRTDPIHFSVQSLAASAHPSTAFSQGRTLYYGDDAQEALEAAAEEWGIEIEPDSDFMSALAKYFVVPRVAVERGGRKEGADRD